MRVKIITDTESVKMGTIVEVLYSMGNECYRVQTIPTYMGSCFYTTVKKSSCEHIENNK